MSAYTRTWFVILLFGTASCLLLLALPKLLVAREASVSFEIEVSAGKSAALYINTFGRPPTQVPIVAGQRHVYTFGGLFSDITLMRLDVSDADGAAVTIFGGRLADALGTFRVITPEEIAAWGRHDLELTEVYPEFIKFVSTGGAPYLMTGTEIPLRHHTPEWLAKLVRGSTTTQLLVPLLMGGFLFLVASNLYRRPMDVILVLAVPLIFVALLPWLIHHTDALAHLRYTVGRAAFLGTSTRGNSIGLLGALLTSALIGVALVFWQRRPGFTANSFGIGERSWRSLHMVGTIAIALIVMPDFEAILNERTNGVFLPDWDGNNFLVWAWEAHQGYEPLRDFWYPYGGMYLFEIPAPYSLVVRAIYKMWIYGALFALLQRLTGKLVVPLIVTTVLFMGEGSFFLGVWRYSLGLIVVLSFLAITDRGEGRLFFWLNCLVVTLFEPVQLAYAALAIVLKLGMDFIQVHPRDPARFGSQLLKNFGLPIIAALSYFAVLISRGQGPGLIDFVWFLRDVSTYGAEPTNLIEAVKTPLRLEFVILVAPITMFAIGFSDRMRNGQPTRFADAMIMVGILGYMMLQKHLVRAMNWQVFFIPFLGIALYAAFIPLRRNVVTLAIASTFAGASVAVLFQIGAVTTIWHTIVNIPAKLASNVGVLVAPGDRFALANSARFAPERFRRFTDESVLVADLNRIYDDSSKCRWKAVSNRNGDNRRGTPALRVAR